MIEKIQDAWWVVAVAGTGLVAFFTRWAVRLYKMQSDIDGIIKRLDTQEEERQCVESDLGTEITIMCKALFCLLDREVEERNANGSVKQTRNDLRDMLAKRPV